MASYAMCHMKLDMMLTSKGYRPLTDHPPRFRVYLTNSLEEGERVNQALPFAQWLSNEAREANTVKNDVPVMVVIGNPPYSGESKNKGDGFKWIMDLMEAYKTEPGGTQKLQERNPKWINDDYAKFIRFAEQMIGKNGEGVLGFITNHGYLDNPTFRGMRWHLLSTFDKIWVLDLHGNDRKKEVAPDGSPDQNVFDIQQGVAIIIAAKKSRVDGRSKPLATVYQGDLWGSRRDKYEALLSGTRENLTSCELPNKEPQYPFVLRDFNLESIYQAGFGVHELFRVNSVGIVTARDALTIDIDRDALWKRVVDFSKSDAEELRSRYHLGDDAQDWTVASAKADVVSTLSPDNIVHIAYRPFDTRWTYFTGASRGFQCRPREEVMRQFFKPNVGLSVCRQSGVNEWAHVFCTSTIVDDSFVSNRSKERGYSLPLYVYEAVDDSRRVNMDPDIRARIEEAASGVGDQRPDELAVFDYIYGVLHCPAYRETYSDFLKIDFPRIPYPPSPETFKAVSAKGTQLRRLHLMDAKVIGDVPYSFTGDGNTVIGRTAYERGAVFINGTQSFQNVPEVVWNFRIGAYQPAQKWLKDRKGRALAFEDVLHYQKIIKALFETDRVMQTIDMPLF